MNYNSRYKDEEPYNTLKIIKEIGAQYSKRSNFK
ncbi:hypothetical protein SAMN04488588_1649 [Geotoga petraea]|jgi:hypothetical protein|uniref:Uncharacterized protein n=1 Tax=Geotoga petraea TaxID=28234 RepID=A0A1G6NT50_9BACT|nr:hypothetical protein SAMN04488588_1649 [Geotoga petraea]